MRLAPEFHDRLSVLAELEDRDMAAYAALLLEKAIVAEFHAIERSVEKLARLGIFREPKDER